MTMFLELDDLVLARLVEVVDIQDPIAVWNQVIGIRRNTLMVTCISHDSVVRTIVGMLMLILSLIVVSVMHSERSEP